MENIAAPTFVQTSPLFKLPPEIRTKLYEMVMIPRRVRPNYEQARQPYVLKENANPDMSDVFIDSFDKGVNKVWNMPFLASYEDFARQPGIVRQYIVKHNCKMCMSSDNTERDATHHCWQHRPTSRALLLTCRAIYKEAAETSYQRTRYEYDWAGDFYKLVRGMRSHGSGRLITNLEFRFHPFDEPRGDLVYHVASLQDGALVRSFPNLKKFSIWFAQGNGWVNFKDYWYQQRFDETKRVIRQMSNLLKEYKDLFVRVKGLASEEIEQLLANSIMQKKWLLPEDMSELYERAKRTGDPFEGKRIGLWILSDMRYPRRERFADAEDLGVEVDENGWPLDKDVVMEPPSAGNTADEDEENEWDYW